MARIEVDSNTLAQAVHELHDLRRRNEILGAKVEMIDLFALVLHSSPVSRGIGMSEDVAWKLQQVLDDAAAKSAN